MKAEIPISYLCESIQTNIQNTKISKIKNMSQAFVKETDDQWLNEVAPSLNALIVHLTKENNGIRVYEQRNFVSPEDGRQVHVMSNGLSYAKDSENKWYVIL
jgi:hypothetical protein